MRIETGVSNRLNRRAQTPWTVFKDRRQVQGQKRWTKIPTLDLKHDWSQQVKQGYHRDERTCKHLSISREQSTNMPITRRCKKKAEQAAASSIKNNKATCAMAWRTSRKVSKHKPNRLQPPSPPRFFVNPHRPCAMNK